MECKTTAPMIVSGRSAHGAAYGARSLAHEMSRMTSSKMFDSGMRETLRWNKQQAHREDRRSKRDAILESMASDTDIMEDESTAFGGPFIF